MKRIEASKRKNIIFHSICEYKCLKQCHKSKYSLQMLHFKQSSTDVVFKKITQFHDFSFHFQPISLRNKGMEESTIVMIV